MNDAIATLAIYQLSDYLSRYYGKKVIILLDEYDTPMQEAYVDGYWKELTAFTRSVFNSAFKTNPWLERAIMTGITRVSKESIFSDLYNLEVVTTTSDKYATAFGFTESEVFAALEEAGLSDKMLSVKQWYDGFVFGSFTELIRQGSADVKTIMEDLIRGKTFTTQIDEQIVFSQLDNKASSIWSLLLASGYLRVEKCTFDPVSERMQYELALTNGEVRMMFEDMIRDWFAEYTPAYNQFIKALLQDDLDAMNEYMSRVALQTFSFFDTGSDEKGFAEPERFYHGFVLGMIVELEKRYVITSNRESGFGRYDIILEPVNSNDAAMIIEFKVYNRRREKDLEDTLYNALQQIKDRKYETDLIARGIPSERIRKYGFAFEGKNVLIGAGV